MQKLQSALNTMANCSILFQLGKVLSKTAISFSTPRFYQVPNKDAFEGADRVYQWICDSDAATPLEKVESTMLKSKLLLKKKFCGLDYTTLVDDVDQTCKSALEAYPQFAKAHQIWV